MGPEEHEGAGLPLTSVHPYQRPNHEMDQAQCSHLTTISRPLIMKQTITRAGRGKGRMGMGMGGILKTPPYT